MMMHRAGGPGWHQASDTAWAAYAATVCTEAERGEGGDEPADDLGP